MGGGEGLAGEGRLSPGDKGQVMRTVHRGGGDVGGGSKW